VKHVDNANDDSTKDISSGAKVGVVFSHQESKQKNKKEKTKILKVTPLYYHNV